MWEQRDATCVIPAHRLRYVAETVELYDRHCWRHEQPVCIMVFDDSSPSPDVWALAYWCLQGAAWPFGIVEAIVTMVAPRR